LSTISTDLGNTAVFPSLCSGGSLRIVPEEEAVSAEGLAEYFTRFPVDCLKIVPTHLSALLSTSQPAQLLPSKCLVLGGEACPSTLVQKIKSSSACAVFNHYGPTETTVGAITFEVTEGALNELPPQLPLGQPLPNTQIYILDKYFVPTPIGVAGEVYIGGSGVGRGYINRPDLTAERFVPDGFSNRLGERLYRTGDRARFSATGEIEFLGRLDHQVKLHGHRIELPEVEAALVRQADVADAVVQISEDDSGNQHLVGWLVPSPERKIDPKTIREHLSQVLPEYMIPYHYVVLNKLPLSASGKIDRKALPAFKFDQSGDRFVAPRNPVAQALAEIWRKVLNLPQVGVFDNFFELGGDSIMSIQIIARANQAGLRLTPRQLFQYQTIAELAELVNESVASIAEQDLVTGVLPLTPVQHRFFEPASDWPHHYNQAVMLQTPVPTDAQLLAQVVDHLIIHHDALRLRFRRDAETWDQWIVANEDNAVFSEIDLSSLTPSERTSTIEEAAAKLQESLNLTDGPLVRAAYFNCGKDPGRMLIIVHHLAVDTVSWWILIEDLETAYHQLKGGHSVGLPLKTASFKAWAEQLSEFSGSAAIDEETNYWLNDARTKVRPLPIDCKLGRNDIASAQTVSVKLSSAETRALLQEVPATYNTQINDALLAALVSACRDFTNNSELLIDLEGHGRETAFKEIDVSRTVGWFTTVFPVLLTCADAQPQEQLLQTKQELRAVPNHGQGYGLLRYMSPLSAALARLPAAEINFNYLGRLDPAGDRPKEFVRTNDPVGGLQPQAALRRYLLTVNGHILNDELKLNFTYSSNLHRRQTVELFANSYVDYLRALIATCSTPKNLTPADFPNARLDQKDLDKLLSQISHLSNAGQN
jgi:non-ribosomal peptide synthase protein (TIGR01720 family)